MTNWLEISVNVDAEAAEAVADVLGRFSGGGVALETGSENAHIDGGQMLVRAYLPIGEDSPQKRQKIREALWHLGQLYPIAPPVFQTVAEADWANAWKEHYHPLRIGQRLVIKPSWREIDYSPDDVLVELDPGMAFGTGVHPTTQMCLAALEQLVRPGMSVLDLGTGSGILAIAAAKLGAGSITALDTDPVAIKIAQENAQRNQVAGQIKLAQGSLDAVNDAYELVVVNILAQVIIELAKQGLAERVQAGGKWVAAGIIEPQANKVREALVAKGLIITEQRQIKDWVTLVGCKA